MELLLCLLLTWLLYLPCPEVHSELQWKGSQIQSQLLWTVRLRVAAGRFDSQKFGPSDPTLSRILWTRSCGKRIYEVSYCCASLADDSGHEDRLGPSLPSCHTLKLPPWPELALRSHLFHQNPLHLIVSRKTLSIHLSVKHMFTSPENWLQYCH